MACQIQMTLSQWKRVAAGEGEMTWVSRRVLPVGLSERGGGSSQGVFPQNLDGSRRMAVHARSGRTRQGGTGEYSA